MAIGSVTVDTRLVGILGADLGPEPLTHVLNEAFESLGLDYVYVPVEVDRLHLEPVVTGLRNMAFAGFNVAKPHRSAIIGLLDALDPPAARSGVVDTVVAADGALTGYDAYSAAFLAALSDIGKITDYPAMAVTVLGTDDTGRSVASALAGAGAGRIYVIDSLDSAARALEADINARFPGCAESVALGSARAARSLEDSTVLVDASGIGAGTSWSESPVSRELLRHDLFVADLAFSPVKSRLLFDAESVGARYTNGIEVTARHAAHSCRLWCGVSEPLDLLRTSLNRIALEREPGVLVP